MVPNDETPWLLLLLSVGDRWPLPGRLVLGLPRVLVLAWDGCVGTACRQALVLHGTGMHRAVHAGLDIDAESTASGISRAVKGLSCRREGAVMLASGGPDTLQRCEPWAMLAKADRGDGHAAVRLPHA